jgi:hypothetical protein
MKFSSELETGSQKTLEVIDFGLSWKFLLGLFLLAVALPWLLLFLPLPYSLYILFGLLVVACMLGLLGLVGLLVCSLIICYLYLSTLLA